jgi:outer membrane immunogenic protein
LLAVVVAVAPLGGVARAGDLQPSDWSGFYVGVDGGGAFGDLVTTGSSLTTSGTLFGITPTTPGTYPGEDSTAGLNGGFGGVYAGINRQNGPLVFGAELDAALSRLTETRTIPGTLGGPPRIDTSADIDWFATLRGRLGVAHGPMLVYGTAGVVVAHGVGAITVTASGGTVPPPYGAGDDDLQTGLVLGGGVETALGRHWTARAEYLHLELPAARYDFAFDTVDSSMATSREAVSENLLRLGLSYKF